MTSRNRHCDYGGIRNCSDLGEFSVALLTDTVEPTLDSELDTLILVHSLLPTLDRKLQKDLQIKLAIEETE